jgi:RNA polymerase subunit RPABC4/transcription elongation factor Spt4
MRRGLLPVSPNRAIAEGTCIACGFALPADALFCPSCGQARARRPGQCAVCGYDLPPGAKWCPGCGAATLGAAPAGARPGRLAIAGYIVGPLVAFVAFVWLVAYLVELGTQKLPVSQDFSGPCAWPVGSNHRGPASFEFGCSGDTYVLTVHNRDAYYVSQPVGVTADAVKYEVDASVTSGRGTQPRVSRPSALLGIACLRRERLGYAGLVGTNGTTEIERWAGGFTGQTGHAQSGSVAGVDGTSNPDPVHLGIVCARQGDGTTLVGLYVNGVLTDAYRDRTGYRSFRQVAVYTATYPGTVAFDSFRATKPAQRDLDAISSQLG